MDPATDDGVCLPGASTAEGQPQRTILEQQLLGLILDKGVSSSLCSAPIDPESGESDQTVNGEEENVVSCANSDEICTENRDGDLILADFDNLTNTIDETHNCVTDKLENNSCRSAAAAVALDSDLDCENGTEEPDPTSEPTEEDLPIPDSPIGDLNQKCEPVNEENCDLSGSEKDSDVPQVESQSENSVREKEKVEEKEEENQSPEKCAISGDEESTKITQIDEVVQNNTNNSDLLTKIANLYSKADELDKTNRAPAVPIKTYQWEDIRRLKKQGGYPWTHLNKAPLGPNDEPEILLRYRSLPKQRKRFEQKLIDEDGSPKSLKKVRINSEILVQETEKYQNGLDDNNNECDIPYNNDEPQVTEEEQVLSNEFTNENANENASETEVGKRISFTNLKQKLNPKGILKRVQKKSDPKPNLVDAKKPKFCHPIVDKLKILAEKHLKPKNKQNSMEEKQKILKLRESPKAGGREIVSYIERHESDDFVEIVNLEESPSETRRRRELERSSLVKPDEVIELPKEDPIKKEPEEDSEPTVAELLEEEFKNDPPPKKATRRQKEHVYEDIEDDPNDHLDFTLMTPETVNLKTVPEIDLSVIGVSGDDLKSSLKLQDDILAGELEDKDKRLSELLTQSSEEEEPKVTHLLAPISSIESASSEDDNRKSQLSAVVEESDQESTRPESMDIETIEPAELNIKTSMKREPSPNSDKRVTFSPSTEDDPDLRKEDVEIAPIEAETTTTTTTTEAGVSDRWKGMSDHEYEPIGEPVDDLHDENEGATGLDRNNKHLMPSSQNGGDEERISIQEMQSQIEDRYFRISPTTTGSRTDCEINTSAVDSSAIEDLPLDRASRKRNVFSNAQERSRQMQQKFRSQAGKLRTKIRNIKPAKTQKRSSPTNKERKKFKAPEFAKFKNISFPKMSKKENIPPVEEADATEGSEEPEAAPRSRFAQFKAPDFSKFKSFDFKKPPKPEPNPETPQIEVTETEEPKPKSTLFKAPDFSRFKKFEFKKSEKPDKAEKSEQPEPTETTELPVETTEVELDEAKPVKTSRFKAPEFSKIKDFKRPEFTKIDFKKPDFSKISFPDRPKFSKPDMSRFKMSGRFSSLKLKRSKSLKESGASTTDSEAVELPAAPKKKFEFGTYPRIFNKMKKGLSLDKGGTLKKQRPGTPPPIIFTTMATSEGTSENESRLQDNESGSYQKYVPESDEFDRESSVERRMREHFSKSMESDEVDMPERVQTEGQRQMADFDEENRAIHEISQSRRDEFKQRKPLVHQDSDIVSETSGNWKEMEENKFKDQEALTQLLNREIEMEKQQQDLETRSIPISNRDTVSSGSASDRQRKNVIEEIDDDEFFLRSKGISQDNIRIGEYISSAIREGLTDPVNALAQVGQYDPYYDDDMELNSEPLDYGYDVPPERPRRVKDSEEPSEDYELKTDFERNLKANEDGDYFNTFPPNKPTRKSKLTESDDHFVPMDRDYSADPENRSFYDNDSEIMMIDDEYYKSGTMPWTGSKQPMPPTPPKAPKRKRKLAKQMMKRIENMEGFTGRSISNTGISNGNTQDNFVVYTTEHKIPLATPEKFTPIPTPPRRTRSRSQVSRITDDDRTSRGADSLISDQHDMKNILDLATGNGYAVIKKEPPPRPPAPLRRKRSTKSLGDRQFSTMPHLRREVSPPSRPKRNYSTIQPPRPPRTKSNTSLGDIGRPTQSSPDVTQYEEIGDSHRDLQSGHVISKMKDRPLPPPPRPERTLQRKKKSKKGSEESSRQDDDDDRDGGGERIVDQLAAEDPHSQIEPSEETLTIGQQLSIEEVDMSTQTDPLPDDFVCDELEITPDMPTITPTQSKTLEDILKEEQEAEIERAQQIIAEQNLSRGIQRFRDANQRSISEKSRASQERPKTPSSRPLSPYSSTLLSRDPVDNEANKKEVEEKIQNIIASAPQLEEEPKILNVEPVHEAPPIEPQVEEVKEELKESTEKPKEEDQRISPTAPITVPPQNNDVEEEIERQAQRLEEIIEKFTESPPPVAPPRRKSSAGEPKPINDLSGRVQISDLDVERLNVTRLQAGNISVSELQGVNITANEFDCSSGNLRVTNLELPPEVIDRIVDRVRERANDISQSPDQGGKKSETESNTQPESPTTRPPLPQGFFAFPPEYFTSIPPASFYQLRSPAEDEPQTQQRRKQKEKEPNSDEDEPKPSTSRQPDSRPSILSLSGQLASACGSAFMQTVREFMSVIPSSITKEANRREINIILLVLIIIIVCLLAIAMGGARTVHHHHWDFFNAPGNEKLD